MRYLVRCKVYKNGNAWTMNSNKGGTRVFNGDIDAFAKFLMKIKAKDDAEDPRSYRSMTYRNMAQEIADGGDNVIYVWSNNWPDKGKSAKVYRSEDVKRMNHKNENIMGKLRMIQDRVAEWVTEAQRANLQGDITIDVREVADLLMDAVYAGVASANISKDSKDLIHRNMGI